MAYNHLNKEPAIYAHSDIDYMLGRSWLFEGHYCDFISNVKHGRNPNRAMLELVFSLAKQLTMAGFAGKTRTGRRHLAKQKVCDATKGSLSAISMNMQPFWNDLWDAAKAWANRNPKQPKEPTTATKKYPPVLIGDYRVELENPTKTSWIAHKVVHIAANINCCPYVYRKDAIRIAQRYSALDIDWSNSGTEEGLHGILTQILEQDPELWYIVRYAQDRFSAKKGPYREEPR
jgi:hypothetical protein